MLQRWWWQVGYWVEGVQIAGLTLPKLPSLGGEAGSRTKAASHVWTSSAWCKQPWLWHELHSVFNYSTPVDQELLKGGIHHGKKLCITGSHCHSNGFVLIEKCGSTAVHKTCYYSCTLRYNSLSHCTRYSNYDTPGCSWAWFPLASPMTQPTSQTCASYSCH